MPKVLLSQSKPKVKPYRHLVVGALIGLTGLQPVMEAASTLPTGGTFTAGSGGIVTSGNAVTISQSSNRGVINWKNFSIGPNGIVSFNNGSGATLNLVNGGAISSILGSLVATGSVYLMNPQGVVIGATGKVNTGGDFVASSLKVSNGAFMNSGSLLFQGGSGAIVKNLGNISSSGGSVFLIGNAVQNSGNIEARNGTVGLGAGQTVLLKDSTSDQRVFVQANGGDVTNSGSLTGAEVELKAAGGNIYALAGNTGGQIRATGTATRNGEVWLIAKNGTLNLAGTVSAENANGAGGSIETSGQKVITSNAAVHTGLGGNWLLDPDDLTIDSALASTIVGALATGNVTEQTSAPTSGGFGDITVDSAISWGTSSSLTLSAYRNVNVNAAITNTSSGNLTLCADNSSSGTGTVNFAGSGHINYAGSTGNVSILYNPAGSASTKYTGPTNYSSFVTPNGSWAAPGDGSVNSQLTAYMLVNNISDLQHINTNLAGTYALGTNLDNAGAQFAYLGNSSTPFTGIFDGQGNIISNLLIFPGINVPVGLFGYNNGTVRNVGLMNETIFGPGYVGGLVGVNQGTIYGSFVNGVINGLSAGGLVGQNTGTINDSYASGSVNYGQVGTAGGLVNNNSGAINSSYSTAIAAYGLTYASSGTTTTSYYDFTSSGSQLSASGTGYSRSTLQAGALYGLSGNIWGFGGVSAIYPYLLWQIPNGTTPVPVYGQAFSDQGHTITLVDSAVKGIANGNDFGQTVHTGADGYYYFLLNSSTAAPGSGLITYLPVNGHAAAFYDNVQGFANVPITGGYLTMKNTPASFTAGVADLKTAGGAVASQQSLPFSVTSGGLLQLNNGTNLDIFSQNLSVTLDQAITTNSLVLEGLQPFTQTAPLAVSDLSLLGAISFTLPNTANTIATLAMAPNRNVISNPGIVLPVGPVPQSIQPLGPVSANVSVFSSRNLLLGTTDAAQGINTTGTATIVTSQGLTIDPGITVEAQGAQIIVPTVIQPNVRAIPGTALILADGTTFTNNSGPAALYTPNGYWQVWSQNPANDNRGGELYNFKQYNATFRVTPPAQATGNGFFYTLAPTLSTTFATVSKQYDATTTAAIDTTSYTPLTGAIDGDTTTLANRPAYGTFDTKNAGTGKTVTVTGLTATATALSGDAKVYGYTVNAAQNLTSIITQAPLAVTATIDTKVYDGGTAASGSASAGAGVFEGDTVALAPGGTYTFNDANAGSAKPVTVSGLALTGADAANYFVSVGELAGSIIPAALYYSPVNTSRSYGTNNPVFTGTVTGLVGSDSLLSVATGNLTFLSPAVPTSDVARYPIFGSGLTLTSGNYTLSQAPGNSTALSVTPLVLGINSPSHPTGQPNVFTLSYNGSAALAIDLSSILSNVQFQTNPANSAPPGTYQVIASAGGALSGDFLFNTGILNVTGGTSTATVPPMPPILYAAPPPLSALPLSILAGPNTTGMFQIGYSAAFDWNTFLTVSGSHTNSLASASSFLVTPIAETPSSDYASGIHP